MTASEPAGLPCAYGAGCQLPATSYQLPSAEAPEPKGVRPRRAGKPKGVYPLPPNWVDSRESRAAFC